mmetsp:Transcript_34830/g.109373  ORF Transcript_34830/g.109373 Transcript_34830/m.109373 type:complete len:416 (+) Transcript_34830:1684-2931(+)
MTAMTVRHGSALHLHSAALVVGREVAPGRRVRQGATDGDRIGVVHHGGHDGAFFLRVPRPHVVEARLVVGVGAALLGDVPGQVFLLGAVRGLGDVGADGPGELLARQDGHALAGGEVLALVPGAPLVRPGQVLRGALQHPLLLPHLLAAAVLQVRRDADAPEPAAVHFGVRLVLAAANASQLALLVLVRVQRPGQEDEVLLEVHDVVVGDLPPLLVGSGVRALDDPLAHERGRAVRVTHRHRVLAPVLPPRDARVDGLRLAHAVLVPLVLFFHLGFFFFPGKILWKTRVLVGVERNDVHGPRLVHARAEDAPLLPRLAAHAGVHLEPHRVLVPQRPERRLVRQVQHLEELRVRGLQVLLRHRLHAAVVAHRQEHVPDVVRVLLKGHLEAVVHARVAVRLHLHEPRLRLDVLTIKL